MRDPSHILETALGFGPSKVLLSAVGFDLFSRLGGGHMTGAELQAALGWHPRGVFDFLDALVAMGYLDRAGDGPSARYANTPETKRYLDRTSPDYIGGILEMANARLFRFWAGLDEAMRTGKPQNEIKDTGKPIFAELYADPAKLRQFMGAMSGFSKANFEMFAERFDFAPYRTHIDVGGATGQLALCVARANPHMRCTSFDLAPVRPIAEETIARAGLADRVVAVEGDFFAAPLPKADVVTMGMILHDWNLEKKMHLIRAAYDALPAGGAFVAIESLIDDARRTNVLGLVMSLNMLIEFGDAFDYTGRDFDGWCREAGFRRTEVVPLAGSSSAAIAYK
jgi:hypothetical protein